MNVTVCIADMPSYTYAVKAERLLRSRGYRCRIARKVKASSDGCGFILRINGQCREVYEILDRYAVPYNILYDDGGA